MIEGSSGRGMAETTGRQRLGTASNRVVAGPSIIRAVWALAGPTVSMLLLIVSVGPLTAQRGSTESAPPDTATLGDGPYARMHTLMERTIFQVDVLTLDLRFGKEDAEQLERLVQGRGYSAKLADSVANVAIHSRDAWARTEFKRGVSLDQFVDGVEDNLKHAREAGVIDETIYRSIVEGLPRWFSFLDERGIHKGDQIQYRIRGDTLRTRFVAADGRILLDQRDVGPQRRLAVLGSYLVRGSEFREGLIESLFRGANASSRKGPSGTGKS